MAYVKQQVANCMTCIESKPSNCKTAHTKAKAEAVGQQLLQRKQRGLVSAAGVQLHTHSEFTNAVGVHTELILKRGSARKKKKKKKKKNPFKDSMIRV